MLNFFFFENTINSQKKDPATVKLQHSFKSMNEEKFKCELNGLDWPNVLRINNDNVKLSFDLFYENINKLILSMLPSKN